MLMETDDETLVRAACSGDRAAFARLLSRHYDRIFALAWRLTGRRDIAADLTQDICTALPARLASFRGEARFSTWLHRMVVNAARDLYRREAARGRAAAGWGEWELARRQAQAEDAGRQRWLAAAMGELPPELRETVALVLGKELTQAEAGTVLGLSEGTIAWRMSEVRRRLRALAAKEAP